jgi:multidrug efflux system outer membrane protein
MFSLLMFGRSFAHAVGGAIAVTILSGCSTGPTYVRPNASIPNAFKELTPARPDPESAADGTRAEAWKTANPAEDFSRGQWWRVFGDPTLDGLENEAADANQNLKAAAARVQQARALVQSARSSWFPTIGAGFGPTQQHLSPASQFLPDEAKVPNQTLWRAQVSASYEADLFGRVSDNVTASRSDEARSEALFKSVQLALQADVAQSYFRIREFDTQLGLYRKTVALREGAVKLVESRFAAGEVSDFDVLRARSELATARADAVGVARERAVSEHGLSILLGKPPADFTFAEMPLVPVRARIPAGLPSRLLERRPDVAAAERAMTAANARIGLANSAFFPQLDITGAFGYESATLGNLFRWSTRTFLLGPFAGTALTLPIFDGGRRSANLAKARAKFDEDVAQYRQQVLTAFKEVEDSLSNLRLLDDQIREQESAVSASEKAERLATIQYKEGQVSFLDVIDAQRRVLRSQLQSNHLAGAQALSTVALIRALGGGWDEPQTQVGSDNRNQQTTGR